MCSVRIPSRSRSRSVSSSRSRSRSPHSPYTVTPVPAIFNKPDADVILRSSNRCDFCVHKSILSQTSSVFEGMFTLPQPAAPSAASTSDATSPPNNELPVVDLTEPGHVLELVLRFCYPVPIILPSTLDVALAVLEAGKKYEMEAITGSVAVLLDNERFVEKAPLRVYLLACQYKLADLARRAAQLAVRAPTLGPFCEEMHAASAVSLFRLVQFQQERVRRAQEVPGEHHHSRGRFACAGCGEQEGNGDARGRRAEMYYMRSRSPSPVKRSPGPAAWWLAYMRFARREAAAVVRECGLDSVSEMDPDAVARAIEISQECEVCRKRPVRQMMDLFRSLNIEMYRVVTEVRLQLDF